MPQKIRQFRLYANPCRCPHDDRPDLSNTKDWKVKNFKAPERTPTTEPWDEITFESPDAVVAHIACTVFQPLFEAVRRHEQYGCTFRLQEKKGDQWHNIYTHKR